MDLRIQNGIIRGMHEQGCAAFKGIPFAKPPVGALRFRPPEPCEDWFGALDCTRCGPRPVQFHEPGNPDKDSAVYSEDCLNLNVWTPSADGKKRPVLFDIYGGGHMEGSNSEPGFAGYHLAREYDIVFVSPNYRVGALGYLYLAHLLGDRYASSGNLGLLDLILALQWVQDNIAFFGGDPEQVTIVGQSAGAKSVMDLLAAPKAGGLFARAVAMSGALQSIKDIGTEKQLTRNFLHAMGLTEETAPQLLTCSAQEIVRGQEAANQVYFKAESYGATADGITLPLDLPGALQNGEYGHNVPLMLGHTLQELWPAPGTEPEQAGEEQMRKKFKWKFGDNWEIPFADYQERLKSRPAEIAYGETATQFTYVEAYMKNAAVFAAHRQPLWLYRWDYTGGLIANHCSDNDALFGRTDPEKQRRHPKETAELDLCYREAVMRFVKTGDPNGGEMPLWPAASEENPVRMLFDAPPKTESFTPEHHGDFPLQVFRLPYRKE